MKRIQKFTDWMPRPITRWLRDGYLASLDIRDRMQGRRDDLVPPRSLHCVGLGDFRAIGEEFFRHFVGVGALRPNETVLDIGCGTGRMAIPLLNHLDATGSYIGFDISEKAVQWCKSHITSRNPHFQFIFSDIRNEEYNPKGKKAAVDYQFPCDSSSIDFAFATSVFTHMRLPEVRHYLEEVQRCLKPSGRAMLTFYIMDGTNQRLVREGRTSANFSTKMEHFYTIDPRVPERAIAYSEQALVTLIADVGLYIRPPIFYGSWSGRQSMLSGQDVVIVTKDNP